MSSSDKDNGNQQHDNDENDENDTTTTSELSSLWTKEAGIPPGASGEELQDLWYKKAAQWYEDHCPPTVNGVLGGFATISDKDLDGSKLFLQEVLALNLNLDWTRGAACECGAGIGRVTRGLLLDLNVTQVDLIESSERLLFEAPDYVGSHARADRCRYYCSGLQDWSPPTENRYTIIWIQWVLCYLTDEDAIAFLQRCAKGLLRKTTTSTTDGDNDNNMQYQGIIVLKENVCGDGEHYVVDHDDASVCRSLEYWLQLVDKAGLKVVYQKMQDDFPSDIFPVPMLALVPM